MHHCTHLQLLRIPTYSLCVYRTIFGYNSHFIIKHAIIIRNKYVFSIHSVYSFLSPELLISFYMLPNTHTFHVTLIFRMEVACSCFPISRFPFLLVSLYNHAFCKLPHYIHLYSVQCMPFFYYYTHNSTRTRHKTSRSTTARTFRLDLI